MTPATTPASSRPWWKALLKVVQWLVNVGLLLALIAQIFFVVVLLRHGEIPIPAFLVQKAEAVLAEKGLDANIGSMQLDLRGLILLRDVKASLPGYQDSVLEADLILLQFPPWGFFDIDFALEEVWVSQLHLYCPAVLSPTGHREPVITDVFTEVRLDSGVVEVKRMLLHFGQLDFLALGKVRLPENSSAFASAESNPQNAQSDPLSKRYQELCRTLLEAHTWIEPFEDPYARMEMRVETETEITLRVRTGRGSVEKDWQAQSLSVDAYAGGRDVETLKLKHADARIKGFSWGGEVKAERLQLGAELEQGSTMRYPTGVNLAGRGLQGWDVKLESFSGRADLSSLKQPALRLLVKDDTQWLKLDGSLNLKDDSSTMHLSALWDPAYFFSLSFLADDDTQMPDFTCVESPRWQATVSLGPDFAFENIHAILDFGKTRYETLELTRVYTHAYATTKELHLTDISLSTSRYTVGGSFDMDFDTDAYRFLLAGQIDPLDIAFIIDEPWWAPLWNDFKFHQELPYANLDLRGFFGGGTRGKYFFGYNKLDDFSYRGVEVHTATAMLWRSPLRMLIHEIDGKGRDGDFSGALQFDYLEDGDDRVSLSFAVKSGIPLDQAIKVVGPEAKEYTEGFSTQAKPQINVYGITYGEDSPHPGELYLNLTSSLDEETVYMDYIFDKVDFHLLKNPQRIDLPRVTFTMAEGQGSGSAVVSFLSEDEPELTLSANLTEAKYIYLQKAIPFLANKETMQQQNTSVSTAADEQPSSTPTTEQADTTASSENLQTALIDLRIDTQGMLGELNTFRGYGSLGVKNAYLGQLHLFGGLSRATQSIGLSLGTVEFTRGHTPFMLGNGYLHFSDIEVSGPTARIKANGNLHMDNNGLDFYLSLFPLGGIDLPVVSQLFSVLDPITNTLEASLTGTMEEPVWNVEFRPIGIFTGQKTVPNPTGEKATDDAEKPSS